jgi:PAS domain S-box-containing protein
MADQSSLDVHTLDPRFQLLVGSVTDYAIYMLDPDGHIMTWNPGARRFKGYEAEEIIGRHFSTFFTEEDRAAELPRRILETASGEGKFEAEGWRVRKDGERFLAHVVVDPIRDEAGKLLGFAKITKDVTERRLSERALFESEQRFRMLVQGVRDYAIYMLDPEGRVSNWNAGAEAIKGYSQDEIVGQHFSRFYTEEDRDAGEPQRALDTALREGRYEREAWRMRKDGSRFWASVVIDPIYDQSGAFVGFGKVTRDITERKRAQEQLDEAREALFQAQKLQALGELTGGIAHDFNNLMTVIRGSAELLQRADLSDEKRTKYLEAIVQTVDRASTLTSHLLAFSRRQAIKPEVIDINVRLDALAEVLARTLGSSIEVKLDLAPALSHVEVDPAQLETALLNAAFNARDAMAEGGRLTLSTLNVSEEGGEFVCIGIADTGEGMSADILARVFEPFFTTKEIGKGTGLGLSQIHGFAAQAGGRAEIASTAGEGTTVRLFLPRSDKPLAATQKQPLSPTQIERIRVLLVEDNDAVRAFAEQLLEDMHCPTVSAASGEEALTLFDADEIDLVFSDVVMPGLSGLDLARQLRALRPELPVVLASGYSEEIIHGATAEFQVLRKPYGARELRAAMEAALRERGETERDG